MSALEEARAAWAEFQDPTTGIRGASRSLEALPALIAEHEKALATLRAVGDVACFTCYGPRPASLSHFIDEAERLEIEAEA